MKKLLLLMLAVVFMSCTQVQASDVNSITASIVKHSIEMGVDPAIALSIARAESGFRHEARCPYGAVGVFQLMPSTASRMGLNAYNAGPGNVKRYNNTVPPYAETKRFIAKIMTDYNRLKANPDPAMINVTAGIVGTPKAAPVLVVVNPEDQLQVEIVEEHSVESGVKPETLKPETFSI